MVKNKTGGKRSKGLARKQHNEETVTRRIRTKEDAAKETKGLPGDYYYAKVVKAHGNCRFGVACDDGVDRMASCLHFAKKNRRDNNVEVGSCLLVGVADFHAATDGKVQPCQILELYQPAEAASITYFQDSDEETEDDFVDKVMQQEVAIEEFDDI